MSTEQLTDGAPDTKPEKPKTIAEVVSEAYSRVCARQTEIRVRFYKTLKDFNLQDRRQLVDAVQQLGDGVGEQFSLLLRALGVDRTTYLDWVREMETHHKRLMTVQQQLQETREKKEKQGQVSHPKSHQLPASGIKKGKRSA